MKGLQGHEINMAKVPVTPGWHPELDTSKELTDVLHTLYMQLIGIGLWISAIGRFDICFAISSLSRYSSAPRANHLVELKKVLDLSIVHLTDVYSSIRQTKAIRENSLRNMRQV